MAKSILSAAGVDRRLLAVSLGVTWLVVATISGTTAFLALGASSVVEWLTLMAPMVRYYGVWMLASIGIFALVNLQVETRKGRLLLLGGHLLIFLCIALLTPMLVSSDWRSWLYGDRAIAFHGLSATIYAFCVLAALSEKFYRLARQADQERKDMALRTLQLEHSLNLARLDALRMQINPHFFFNALNSVASLVQQSKNDDAYRSIELLGDLLRNVLAGTDDRSVQLKKELALVDSYVGLEKIRYGDRIALTTNVKPSALNCMVPRLLVQPLIENVVKHVIARCHDAIEVRLDAWTAAGKLILEVSDNGQGFNGDTVRSGGGVGLQNIQRRLQLVYGEAAEMILGSSSSGGAKVRVAVPIDRVDDTGVTVPHVVKAPPATNGRTRPASLQPQ